MSDEAGFAELNSDDIVTTRINQKYRLDEENPASVNVSSQQLDDVDIDKLIDFIKSTNPTHLNFSFCQFKTAVGTTTGISRIFDILPSTVVSLNLMGLGLNSTSMRSLASKIKEMPNLGVLNLSQNPIRNAHMNVLYQCLSTHASIKELYLAKVFINDDAFVSIKSIIELGLEKLDLGWGVFVSRGFSHLVSVLSSRHCRLNYLGRSRLGLTIGLSFSNISAENSSFLSSFIQRNKSLDTIDIRFTDIPKDDTLTSSCLSNTTLSYYVRNFNNEIAMNEFMNVVKIGRRLLHPVGFGEKVYYVNGNMPSLELDACLEDNVRFMGHLDRLGRKMQVFAKFVRMLSLPREIKEIVVEFGIDEEFVRDKRILVKYLSSENGSAETAKGLIRAAYYIHGPA